MVFYQNLPFWFEIGSKFAYQPFVFFLALPVDDIGQKDDRVRSRDRIGTIVAGNEPKAVFYPRLSDHVRGDFKAPRQVEDGDFTVWGGGGELNKGRSARDGHS